LKTYIHSPVVVAFSGGADSAFLAWVAHDTLGHARALSVTAVSPSLPAAERAEVGRLVALHGDRDAKNGGQNANNDSHSYSSSFRENFETWI
jgi:PP-loop superfamily ATP-utilizing enzyme